MCFLKKTKKKSYRLSNQAACDGRDLSLDQTGSIQPQLLIYESDRHVTPSHTLKDSHMKVLVEMKST